MNTQNLADAHDACNPDAEAIRARSELWQAIEAKLPATGRRTWEIRIKRYYRRALGWKQLPIREMTAEQARAALAIVREFPGKRAHT